MCSVEELTGQKELMNKAHKLVRRPEKGYRVIFLRNRGRILRTDNPVALGQAGFEMFFFRESFGGTMSLMSRKRKFRSGHVLAILQRNVTCC